LLPVALSLFLLSAAPEATTPWPGEASRVHFGIGYRAHGGVMLQRGAPFLLLESELLVALDVKLPHQHSLRVQLGVAAGWPNALAGETNVSLRLALSPRWSWGLGVFGSWGLFALRGGLEVPISARLGDTRRHELTLALRLSPGAYNNVSFVWWDFPRQYFAFSADATLGYTFFF
jgi:hypothetical protein